METKIDSKSKILAICIPTYNKKQKILSHVKKLLALDEDRFCININDNNSTDGLEEDLGLINDSRVIYHREGWNKGAGINTLSCMANVPSQYILICIDKNEVNAGALTDFINYLEEYQPNFGYVRGGEDMNITESLAGLDALLASSYESRHPTGWFFRTDLFNKELKSNWFAITDKTEWSILDMFAAGIGCDYNYFEVVSPMFPAAWVRNYREKTKSFNEHNVYFGFRGRLKTFLLYIQQLESFPLSEEEKSKILAERLKLFVQYVTILLYKLYLNDNVRYGYGLTDRKISFIEMNRNARLLLQEVKGYTKIKLSRHFYMKLYLKSIYRNMRCAVAKNNE